MMISTVPVATSESAVRDLGNTFQEHHRLIYRTAFGVTRLQQDAEDVLQTIFLRLLQREVPLSLRECPKAYLFRAAVNLSLNTVRSRKRLYSTNCVEELDGSVQAPESSHQNDIQDILRNAIAQLKPQAAEILMLRYEHNFSDAEIARMIGKSRGAVAVSLYRTRARLKKDLHAITQGKS